MNNLDRFKWNSISPEEARVQVDELRHAIETLDGCRIGHTAMNTLFYNSHADFRKTLNNYCALATRLDPHFSLNKASFENVAFNTIEIKNPLDDSSASSIKAIFSANGLIEQITLLRKYTFDVDV